MIALQCNLTIRRTGTFVICRRASTYDIQDSYEQDFLLVSYMYCLDNTATIRPSPSNSVVVAAELLQ